MGKCKHDILKIKSEKKNQYEYAVAISIEEKENLIQWSLCQIFT